MRGVSEETADQTVDRTLTDKKTGDGGDGVRGGMGRHRYSFYTATLPHHGIHPHRAKGVRKRGGRGEEAGGSKTREGERCSPSLGPFPCDPTHFSLITFSEAERYPHAGTRTAREHGETEVRQKEEGRIES